MLTIGPDGLEELLQLLQQRCKASHLTIATAESCTGGLLSALLSHRSGSSSFFLGGVVAYANSIKTGILAVPELELQTYGAVSLEVASSMARGVGRLFQSQLSCAITGIAGPGGDTPSKPLGFVCFAWTSPQGTISRSRQFFGNREDIRAQSCRYGLETLLEITQTFYPEGLS